VANGDHKAIISLKVIANSKVESFEWISDETDEVHLRLKVRAVPVDGAANEAVISALSKLLGVARGRIHILKGLQSRQKRIEISDLSQEILYEILLKTLKNDLGKAKAAMNSA
jgi:uncharacterized protein (TIGR00251 family)